MVIECCYGLALTIFHADTTHIGLIAFEADFTHFLSPLCLVFVLWFYWDICATFQKTKNIIIFFFRV